MAKPARPTSVHPTDPLNSYREPTFRGWIITGIATLVVMAALWLAYGAALNDAELQQQMDGREGIQGPLYAPDDAPPGGR